MSGSEEWRRGWPVVLAAAIGVGVSLSSLFTFSFGVIVKPLCATLGWSRGEASGMHFFVAFSTLIGAPLIGIVVDRVGPRRVALAGIPVASAAYASLCLIGPNLTIFYALTFGVGLLAVATGPIVWTRAVTGWFRVHRGLALACTLVGSGVFALLGPPAVTGIVEHFGWRAVFLALGGLMLLSWVPTFLWFSAPAILPGRTPGDSAAGTSGAGPAVDGVRAVPAVPTFHAALEPGATLREAVLSRRFWTIGAGLFLASVGCTAVIAHLVPMLTDRGVAPAIAARVAATLGLSIVAGRLLAGRCLDRFATGTVCAAVMASAALGCLLMLNFDGEHLGIPVVVAMLVGIAAGSEVDLVAYLAAKYYGLAAYGKIYGLLFGVFALGAGSAPVLAGFMFDASGNYQRALVVLALAFAGSAALLGSLGREPGLGAAQYSN